jgi:hypothetical protein
LFHAAWSSASTRRKLDAAASLPTVSTAYPSPLGPGISLLLAMFGPAAGRAKLDATMRDRSVVSANWLVALFATGGPARRTTRQSLRGSQGSPSSWGPQTAAPHVAQPQRVSATLRALRLSSRKVVRLRSWGRRLRGFACFVALAAAALLHAVLYCGGAAAGGGGGGARRPPRCVPPCVAALRSLSTTQQTEIHCKNSLRLSATAMQQQQLDRPSSAVIPLLLAVLQCCWAAGPGWQLGCPEWCWGRCGAGGAALRPWLRSPQPRERRGRSSSLSCRRPAHRACSTSPARRRRRSQHKSAP